MIASFARLIGRLSVSRKLLLIYLLDLTAVIFITGILIEEKFIAIDFARKELQGNTYIADVRQILFATVAAHDGHASLQADLFQEKLEKNQREHGEDLNTADVAEELQETLAKLSASRPAEQAEPHLQAFRAGRNLVAQIGDQSNLILDPDLDSYYLMSLTVLRFPELLDQLLHLSRPGIGEDMTRLLITKGKIEALLDDIEGDYRAALASNRAGNLPGELTGTRNELLAALQALVQTDVQDGGKIQQQRAATLAALQSAWEAGSASLHRLLEVRVDSLFNRMWTHLGMAAALLAGLLFMVFYVASQISIPLRRLARVTEQVKKSHDYKLRAEWHSEDEIGDLVAGFNTMLERLDRERLIQQELAAQARAAQAQSDLLEAIPIPLIVTAVPEHKVLHANAPAGSWVDAGQEDPWSRGLASGTRARFFQRLADEGNVHEFEVSWNTPRGTAWALMSASRLRYQGQDAVVTTFTPINSLKRLEARLKLLATIFEATSEGILVLDPVGTILLANAALARATGYRVDELISRSPEFLESEQMAPGVERPLCQLNANQGSWQGEYWLKTKGGTAVPQWLVLNTVRDDRGEVSHIIALFVDISERKAQEEQIRHLAHHDALTGLPNRLLFNERLSMCLKQADRHEERVAVLFIDLDRFKNVNDSLGHHVGDGLLQSVAQRLEESIRSCDTVCRQGGDEFVVILNDVADEKDVAQTVEQRLIPRILQPHLVCDVSLHISCSVGVAIYPDDGRDINTLMRNADAAMYAAKTNGRNNFQFFSEDMNRQALERLSTESRLQEALYNREFELHVQPVIDIASGRTVSVEALLRWRQPSMGMIPPGKFIPIAEENGLIVPIGRWALEEACRLHLRWHGLGMGRIPVAVNVSAVQFRQGNFPETVREVLAASGMPAQCLQLEITESLMMTESERTIQELSELKKLGVTLCLDDFGTGYSSLSYLHRFPIDKLKIDRSFVHDIIEDPADLAITRAIIGLGHTLGLRVVAEGVEHREELDILRAAGCDEVQGYYFSPPIQCVEFEAWTRDSIAHRQSDQLICDH